MNPLSQEEIDLILSVTGEDSPEDSIKTLGGLSDYLKREIDWNQSALADANKARNNAQRAIDILNPIWATVNALNKKKRGKK